MKTKADLIIVELRAARARWARIWRNRRNQRAKEDTIIAYHKQFKVAK